MSQQKTEALVEETFSDGDVVDYLQQHPDFFDRNPSLLMHLEVTHETGGSAVSLIERQISLLRQRSDDLERQLKDLVAVAKINDALVTKIHKLALGLMTTTEIAERVELLEVCLREEFRAERAALVLFAPLPGGVASGEGFLKIVERGDSGLKPFASFLKSARPRCGIIRDRQKAFLFEDNAGEISSAAQIPLGARAEHGFLVIGSSDPDYFNPGKGMDFLARLGELVAGALVGPGNSATAAGTG